MQDDHLREADLIGAQYGVDSESLKNEPSD